MRDTTGQQEDFLEMSKRAKTEGNCTKNPGDISGGKVVAESVGKDSSLVPLAERTCTSSGSPGTVCHVPKAACKVLEAACDVPEVACNVSRVTRHVPEAACQLAAWGLPDTILGQYAEKGIRSMFPWQVRYRYLLNNYRYVRIAVETKHFL